MDPKHLLTLELLRDHPRGLFGREIVTLSRGQIGMAGVFAILEALTDAGLVAEAREDDPPPPLLPRTRHFLTMGGRRVMFAASAPRLDADVVRGDWPGFAAAAGHNAVRQGQS